MKIYQIFRPGVIAGFLGFLALSCTGSFRGVINSTTATANESEPNLVYGELIFPENSDYLLIPVGLSENYRKNLGSILPNQVKNPMTVYNLIFHQKQTGESHLLLSDNSIISSFRFIDFEIADQNSDKKALKNKFILLEIISEDTNNDQKIDREDAIVAYLADASGKNVTQITPNNTKLVSWHLDRERRFILLKVSQDSDQDQKFTAQDDTSFIRVKLNEPKIGSDIITEPMRKQINQRL